MSVLDTVPAGAQARILRAILNASHPRLALPTIASNHHLSIVELQTIAGKHGYPDQAAMRRAVARLEGAETSPADDTESANEDAFPEASQRLLRIPLTQLHADPNNVRENLGNIDELAESITQVGLLQPIVARRHGDQLIVVAGHRRLAAVHHLGWTTVPVTVRGAMAPDEVLAAMLIENSQRADLDPIEEARGLMRLRTNFGVTTDAELAHRVGRTQVHVSNRLVLLALTPEDQDAVRRGELTIGAATDKARTDSGRRRPGAHGKKSGAHLSVHHELATKARNRCATKKHKKGGSASVGGIACGDCWESVIRADERVQLHAQSETRGRCVLCDTEHDPDRRDSSWTEASEHTA